MGRNEKRKRQARKVAAADKRARAAAAREARLSAQDLDTMAPGDAAARRFLEWASSSGFTVHKGVQITGKCVSGRGVINGSSTAIPEGTLLFQIPRDMLLSPRTTAIAETLHGMAVSTEGSWVPLLLALMHEYTAEDSRWKPYFDILPKLEDLPQPHFWAAEDRSTLLAGTSLEAEVAQDLASMAEQYRTDALPVIQAHPDLFQPEVHTLELFQRLSAIVMGYSFSDDETGNVLLAPFADTLNHVTGKNNARLFYEDAALQMIAIEEIQPGAEIFNTYGELSNRGLLRKHGFCEPAPTPFEDVVLEGPQVVDLARRGPVPLASTFEERDELLAALGYTAAPFFLSGDEPADALAKSRLLTTVAVLTATDHEFAKFSDARPEAPDSDCDEDDDDAWLDAPRDGDKEGDAAAAAATSLGAGRMAGLEQPQPPDLNLGRAAACLRDMLQTLTKDPCGPTTAGSPDWRRQAVATLHEGRNGVLQGVMATLATLARS